MITVFHNKTTDFFTDLNNVLVVDLDFVAEVQTNSLDEAYKLTQNIDEAWVKNWQVRPNLNQAQYRSTSVGDVLQKGTDFYIVQRLGFYRVIKRGGDSL